MRSIREILFRLQPFWRRRTIESGLSEEIESHIAMATEANIAAGMSPREARYAALREFGGVEQIKERYRDERGLRWLEETLGDIRIAARSLRKSPGFTTVAVLTLALCIGANSAVFSVVHAILLKPYPWPESGRLVYIYNTMPLLGRQRADVSIPDYLDHRNGVAALEESALGRLTISNLTTGSDPTVERILGFAGTPSLFRLLRARPALGRAFSEDDAKMDAPKTVILSDALWRNRFGADPNIIGKEIRSYGVPSSVIGVMPPDFYFPNPRVQMWTPLGFTVQQKSDSARAQAFFTMIARLKQGATVAQAQREVTAVHQANVERLPQFKASWEASGFGVRIAGFLEENVKNVRAMLWLVQGAVAAVLFIGCANVASLLLARASARERELAVRAALGASRGRLIRHLLTESVLLFIAGGLFGLLVASWGLSAMNHFGAASLPRSWEVSLDATVFGFTLGGALVTGILFGALPAWSATCGDTSDALKDAAARATTGRRNLSLRSALVVTEIALALMLLATASLLIKSFQRLQDVSPGFTRENVLTAGFAHPATKYGTVEKQISFYEELLERVRSLPGVTSADCASALPFGGVDGARPYKIDGYTTPAGQPGPEALVRAVSLDYFKTLGIRLLRGRVFTAKDSGAANGVAVIDKSLADRYWPAEDPIGKRLIYGVRTAPNAASQQPRIWEIVGVVAPVKQSSLEATDVKETIYFPVLQNPGLIMQVLIVKTSGPASQMAAALRAAVQAIDPEVPFYDITTMEARLEGSMERRRTPMMLLAVFAGISLLLAALGIYGVLAFAVGQRGPEIGVRMALGATGTNIVRMVLRQGAALVALGLVLGLGGYFALSTVIRKLLFSVETTDFAALILAPATLALVALAACLIPARRATKVDPIVALRAE